MFVAIMSCDMNSAGRLMIGMMSGTSADGVDVAIARITGSGLSMCPQLLQHHHYPYLPGLRTMIFTLRGTGAASLAEMARAQRQITLAHVEALHASLEQVRIKPEEVTAIAAHGQTMFHAPPDTVQWLDPALLASRTNCAVVSDFRRADCAAGGQGAPLVPFADYLLFRHERRDRVLLNIGGIANLTWIPAGGSIDNLRAFDTGPGNCISDWLCREKSGGEMSFDVNGQGALRGRVLETIVEDVMGHDYFARPIPKSTDGPEMIAAFRAGMGEKEWELNDLLATASYITAWTIAGALRGAGIDSRGAEWIVSGGGIHNRAMMNWLKKFIGAEQIVQADELGVLSEAKEALAFALLGAATLDNFPANVPSCTGAQRRVVLGCITPARQPEAPL